MYRKNDKVIFKSKRPTKYKFCPPAGTVGTVIECGKYGVLVQWPQTDVWSGKGWCRFGEVRKYTALDALFDTLVEVRYG